MQFCRTQLADEFEKFDLSVASTRRSQKIAEEVEAYGKSLDEKFLQEENKLKGAIQQERDTFQRLNSVTQQRVVMGDGNG